MAVTVVVFEPGEVLRCVAVREDGWECRKPFGQATQTCAVAIAGKVPRGDMLHRCRACRTNLDVFLGVEWTRAA